MSQPSDTPENTGNPPLLRRRGWLIILMLFAAMIYFSRQPPVETIDCTPQIMATKPEVVMLGAWWCSYCYQAKRYFQRNNIRYCEYDMENTTEGRRLYEKHGGGAVPILLIGKYRLSGFNEEQIERALQLSREQAGP